MIEKALKYIVGQAEPRIETLNGDIYSDKPLHRIDPYIPRAAAIDMHTLSSLVDYIKANVDVMAEKMILQVVSPKTVHLFSQLDDNREREYIAVVEAQVPLFDYGSFIEHETFCINVQSKFITDDTTDKELLLKFAGTVEAGTVADYGDNGITQKATVKTGIASKTDAVVPNPVRLKPFRTFVEVEQPTSSFIFRMKEGRMGGVDCAIFEADGGAWKNEAMNNIKAYLETELAELKDQFVVIS